MKVHSGLSSIIVVSTIMVAVGIIPARTRADVSVAVKPISFNLEVDPGDSTTQKLTLENTGTEQLPLAVKVFRFEPDDTPEAAPQLVSNDGNPYAGKVKIELSPSQLILQPREEREIKLRLTAATDAQPGTYLLAITPEYNPSLIKPDGSAINVGSSTKSRIVVPVVTLVKGKVNYQGSIKKFSVTQSADRKGPVQFNLEFLNSGLVHYQAKTKFVIMNGGKQINTIEIEPKIILPGRSRTISYRYEKYLAPGNYTARAFVSYGTDFKKIATATTTFTVGGLGIKTIVTTGGIVLAGLVILFSMGRGKRRSTRREKPIRRRGR